MPGPQINPQDAGQASKLFEQGFSDMANRVLSNKYPNLANDVVTFKVLNADVDAGSATGAFVVLRGGQTVYVPAVLSDNQLKPLDLMYLKDRNIFLPLTKEWLAKIEQLNPAYLGQAGKPSKTMNTDVDIRNVVIPPTTGRYSYASAHLTPEAIASMYAQAGSQTDDGMAGSYLRVIGDSPDVFKIANLHYLKMHTSLYHSLVKHYGHQKVAEAFQLRGTKTAAETAAAEKMPESSKLLIADQSTAPGDFKKIFGSQSALAFTGVKTKGYYAQDGRKNLHRPVSVQETVRLTETKDSGIYKLWCVHGKVRPSLVVNDPIDILPNWRQESTQPGPTPIGKRIPVDRHHSTYRLSPDVNDRGGIGSVCATGAHGERKFVGVTENGKLLDSCEPFMGEPGVMDDLTQSKVFNEIVGKSSASPRQGQEGFFLLVRGGRFIATEPVKIKSVTTDSENLTVLTIGYLQKDTWKNDDREATVIYGSSPGGRIMAPQPGHVPTRVPSDTLWVATTGEGLEARDFCTDPRSIAKLSSKLIAEAGINGTIVKKSSQHGFTFGDRADKGYDFVGALKKLALDANISIQDAESTLNSLGSAGRVTIYPVPLNKIASLRAAFDKMAGPADAGGGGAQPAQDPDAAAAGGDPSQDPAGAAMAGVPQAPQAPAMPSPVDMAVAEQVQNIQSQMTGLQAQLQTLQAVQDRANMIAGMGGAMGAPAAAAGAMAGPMDPSMMGAGSAPAQPGQPQPQPGQPQPQQGMPPGASPGQPGQPDPSQGQQPMTASMTAETNDPAMAMQQVNPQFAEQAGQLQDAGAFDTGMLGSMAQTPALRDLVGAYLPNLEKALDNAGRMLLTLWMDEQRIKEDLGDESYVGIETNMRTFHRNLGDLILKINQTSSVLRGPNDRNFEV